MLWGIVWLLAGLICAPGCATPRPPSLEVRVVNLRFERATVLDTRATFFLRLENEDNEPIRVEGGVHSLVLNGTRVGKGLVGETVEVPRLGAVEQAVEVHLSHVSLATRLRSILEAPRVAYRLESRLYTVSNGRKRTVTLVREGELDLERRR